MTNTYSDGIAVARPITATAVALTFDDRWAQWEAKGVSHDALVARKIRLTAVIVANGRLDLRGTVDAIGAPLTRIVKLR